MGLVVLLVVAALICFGIGAVRGITGAMFVGAVLMADALLAYLLIGPVSGLTHQLFGH
ncbi:MAG TPA: hypothetical protein VMV93_09745 [Chloroflexota bacterium]|nr:hypothetical protein [Chloroflexota bacterium]